jgi:hypothetical protein
VPTQENRQRKDMQKSKPVGTPETATDGYRHRYPEHHFWDCGWLLRVDMVDVPIRTYAQEISKQKDVMGSDLIPLND